MAALKSLFVLLTTLSFALPLWEGFLRRSPFWTVLFAALLVSSFTVHCEETGICDAYPVGAHTRLLAGFSTLNFFMMNSMLLVVLEVKAEVVCRMVVAVATVLLFFLRDPSDVSTTIPVTLALGTVIFVIDAVYHRRRFTAAYWRRLGLIGALAGAGAGLFSLLKLLSFTHGVWHLYLATGAYLLLLAQRHKRALAASRLAQRGGGTSSSGHSSSTQHHGQSTPLKRGGRGGAVSAAADVLAGSEPGSDAELIV